MRTVQRPCRAGKRVGPSPTTARFIGATLLALGLICVPSAARGQTQPIPGETVTALLNDMFVSPAVFNPAQNPLISEADYRRRSQDSLDGIGIGIGNALASFPLGASSAGFTYVVDPATGERVLKTTSFGAIFVERGLSNGRGVLNVGFAYQHGSYDVLAGNEPQGRRLRRAEPVGH